MPSDNLQQSKRTIIRFRYQKIPFIWSNTREVKEQISNRNISPPKKSIQSMQLSKIRCPSRFSREISNKPPFLPTKLHGPVGLIERKNPYLNAETNLETYLDARKDEQSNVLRNYKYYNSIIRKKFLMKSFA